MAEWARGKSLSHKEQGWETRDKDKDKDQAAKVDATIVEMPAEPRLTGRSLQCGPRDTDCICM